MDPDRFKNTDAHAELDEIMREHGNHVTVNAAGDKLYVGETFSLHESWPNGKPTYVTKDSGIRKDYASGFRRDVTDGKPRYDLIPLPMLKRLAELYARGAEKYGENNWQLAKGDEEMGRFKASAFRHFIQWLMAEDDGEDHASAVVFNIYAYETRKDA